MRPALKSTSRHLSPQISSRRRPAESPSLMPIARARPQRLNRGRRPRPGAPRDPSGRGARPASCAWPCPPTRPARGLPACPVPSSGPPDAARPDRSIMAQRRPANCRYVTSSHVSRPPGRGAGGVRAGVSRLARPGGDPNPFISLIYSASSTPGTRGHPSSASSCHSRRAALACPEAPVPQDDAHRHRSRAFARLALEPPLVALYGGCNFRRPDGVAQRPLERRLAQEVHEIEEGAQVRLGICGR